MSNAVKFTSKGGEIELKIEKYKSETEGGKPALRFSVRDTGIGIDPVNYKKIFEAFSQEDASINRKYGGTGLGLAISKKLLGLMGSELQLNSKLNEGSTFFFDLHHIRTMDGEAIEWTSTYDYKNILIVDDNFNNRLILRNMLAMALKKINIDEAENGIKALEKLKKEKYDLILMDYHMPEMDGLTTIKNIRDNLNLSEAEQPIMLLHCSADDESVDAACKELEVHQRLVKPIKMKQLFESLSKVKDQLQNKKKRVHAGNGQIKKDNMNSESEGFRILVVEDNAFNTLLIKTMIGNLLPNASIVEAINGKEAVECFKATKFDIVFMDIQMPEMNGYEATIEIRKIEKGSRVPIVALTAGTLKDERDKCLNVGMDDYIIKPIVTASVVGVIHKWLMVSAEKEGNWDI
jgi:CheY-like chemotaxis protein